MPPTAAKDLKRGLKKAERLHKRSEIERLFASRESFVSYPIRFVYLLEAAADNTDTAAILLSVPKKKFKRAVDRNLLKRRMREAYRLHKQLLWEERPSNSERKTHRLMIACLYLSAEILPYSKIENAMRNALQRLAREYTGLSTEQTEEQR